MKLLKSRTFKIFIIILFIAIIIICNWSRIINLMLPAGSRPAEINFKVEKVTADELEKIASELQRLYSDKFDHIERFKGSRDPFL